MKMMKSLFMIIIAVSQLAYSEEVVGNYEIVQKESVGFEAIDELDSDLCCSFLYNGKLHTSDYVISDSVIIFTDKDVNRVWNQFKDKINPSTFVREDDSLFTQIMFLFADLTF